MTAMACTHGDDPQIPRRLPLRHSRRSHPNRPHQNRQRSRERVRDRHLQWRYVSMPIPILVHILVLALALTGSMANGPTLNLPYHRRLQQRLPDAGVPVRGRDEVPDGHAAAVHGRAVQ